MASSPLLALRAVTRALAGALLGSLAVSALPACASGGSTTPGARQPAAEDHPLLGETAPDFDLPAQWGADRADLSAYRGRIVIVDFWATWCKPCRRAFPELQALSDRYGDRVAVVAIAEDDGPGGVARFARETGVRFVLAWDPDGTIARRYRPTTMPTSYLIDSRGRVRYVHAGFRRGDAAVLEHYVGHLLRSGARGEPGQEE